MRFLLLCYSALLCLCASAQTLPLDYTILGHNVVNYEDAVEYMSNSPHHNVIEASKSQGNNGYIYFEYDGGVDWLTGFPGDFFITYACYRHNDLPFIRIKFNDRKSNHNLQVREDYAKHVIDYMTQLCETEPRYKYNDYAHIKSYFWTYKSWQVSLELYYYRYIDIWGHPDLFLDSVDLTYLPNQ